MTEQTQKRQSKYQLTDKNSVFFKLFLAYDIFMVFIIVFNLFCLGMNLFLMSYLGEWFFQNIHLPELLSFYRTHLHPWVVTTEAWFIVFLISELLIRWGLAIAYKHHARWWFFPFIHWYEVLAIIPLLRFFTFVACRRDCVSLASIGLSGGARISSGQRDVLLSGGDGRTV